MVPNLLELIFQIIYKLKSNRASSLFMSASKYIVDKKKSEREVFRKYDWEMSNTKRILLINIEKKRINLIMIIKIQENCKR